MNSLPKKIKIVKGLEKEDLFYFKEGEEINLVDAYQLKNEKDKWLYVAENTNGLKICLYDDQFEVIPC